MGRPRNPERDKSLQRYLDADGKIGTAELAKLAGVPESRISLNSVTLFFSPST